uniref:FHA domain-containing protein n=1 Tax=Panagrellus redivivus TaxID=6233 RepID=A0A7E4UMX7_PANRE
MAVNKNPPSSKQPETGPVMLLTPCHNSHEFQDRRVVVPRGEDSAVKIGRAVGRFAATPNNAIFDCKVLSRNHAVVWCEEDTFFIKDTKSSNGTFINNHRLSGSSEVSGPVQLNSGDILQLGVEIVDNTKRVASGCVVAMVRFLNEKGEEIGNRRSAIQDATSNMSERIPKNCLVVSEDQMYQMQQYIFEAKHRESALGNKLMVLQEALKSAKIAAEANWQAMINEDRLLSRIEVLESQLTFCLNKNLTDVELKAKVQEIFNEREKLESSTKDRLRKYIEEASEARLRHEEAEIALMNVEEQNTMLKESLSDTQRELGHHKAESEKLNSNYEVVCRELENARAENQKLATRIKELEKEVPESTEEAEIKDNASTTDLVTMMDPVPSEPAPVGIFPKVELPPFTSVLNNRVSANALLTYGVDFQRLQKGLEGLASEGSAYPGSPLDIQHMICDLIVAITRESHIEAVESENTKPAKCCLVGDCNHDVSKLVELKQSTAQENQVPNRQPEDGLISLLPLFSLIVLVYYYMLAFTSYLPHQLFASLKNVDHDTATGLDTQSDKATSSPAVETATEAESMLLKKSS